MQVIQNTIDKKVTRWYALRTKSRCESKAYMELKSRGIESFLPLHLQLKQWSDRLKWVQEPLIRSYIFVKISEKQFDHARFTPHISGFVRFGLLPEAIPSEQIEALQYMISECYPMEVLDKLPEPGEEVEIIFGSMNGIRGKMIKSKGKSKVLIRIDSVDNAILVDLPAHTIRKVKSVLV